MTDEKVWKIKLMKGKMMKVGHKPCRSFWKVIDILFMDILAIDVSFIKHSVNTKVNTAICEKYIFSIWIFRVVIDHKKSMAWANKWSIMYVLLLQMVF